MKSSLFRLHLGDTKNTISQTDFRELGHITERYSGADVGIAVRDALMEPVRKVTLF